MTVSDGQNSLHSLRLPRHSKRERSKWMESVEASKKRGEEKYDEELLHAKDRGRP